MSIGYHTSMKMTPHSPQHAPAITPPLVAQATQAPQAAPREISPVASSLSQDQLQLPSTAAGSSATRLNFVESQAQARSENLQTLMQSLKNAPIQTKLNRVNYFFNQNIRYTSDLKNHGVTDHWQTQAESLKLGKGDCEDYALAKYQALKDLGVPEKELHVFYVKNRNNIAHMVLLHTDSQNRSQVLDNESSLVLPLDKRKDLRPVYGFNQGELVLANGPEGWLSGDHKPGKPNLKRFNQFLAQSR